MPSDHAHRLPEAPHKAWMQMAIEDELFSRMLWQAAVRLRERDLIKKAEEFEAASRSARIEAMQCRIRAGVPLE